MAEKTDGLYNLIAKSKHVRFLDVNGQEHTVNDLTGQLYLPNERGLAFLYLDNAVDALSVLLSFLKEDWVLALLSPKLDLEFKEKLETRYRPVIIYDQMRSTIAGFEKHERQKGSYLFLDVKADSYPLHPSLKILLSTSGSTGSPKFVKLSEYNLVQNAYSILDYLPIKSTDVTPLNLPLYYSYGFSIFTTNAIAGAKLVCTNSDVMQKKFWEEWARFQYTSFAGVPYIYEVLARLGFLKQRHPSLRYLTQAGGRLNKKILEQYALYAIKSGIDCYVMYGQTEATARMSFLPPEKLMDKLGAIGRPIKNGTFHLNQETGELLYTGPNVYGGYANGPKDLANFEQPDVLHTGDLAEQDNDGFYYITGRMKRIVKLFGTRINLDEIEQLLKNNFDNADFVCLGVEDKHLVVACVKTVIAEEDIKEILHKKVHIHPNVIRIYPLNEVILTPNGKIDYKTTAQKLGVLS